MDLRNYADVLRKRWFCVVLGLVFAVAVSAVVTVAMPRKYTSDTQLFFATTGAQSNADINEGSSFTQQQMKSFSQVATSPSVLQPVIDKLGLATTPTKLAKSVVATSTTSTVVMDLSVEADSAQSANEIATAISVQLITVVQGLSPARSDGSATIKVSVITPATLPSAASSPKPVRNIGIGVLVGLVIGIAAALLVENFDTRIRSGRDLKSFDVPELGGLPTATMDDRMALVRDGDSESQWAEAVRRVRTNLQFVAVTVEGSVFQITSAIPGEGKTTTAIAVAAALALTGERVLLVDGDLRRPSVAKTLGIESHVGLTTVLVGRARLRDVVQPWQDSTLDVLPLGRRAPNPSELLGSERMKVLIKEMAASYDRVIIDAPPVLPVTDSAVLTRWTDGVVFVACANKVKRPEVGAALDSLQQVDANVLGIVLNRLDGSRGSYGDGYGYRYEYRSSKDSSDSIKKDSSDSINSVEEVAPIGRMAPRWPTEQAPQRARESVDLDASSATSRIPRV
ncbi:polysaccharide biosynthesis tyrosine autokinase [Propionibacterium sp.]|uniref:polysaccharide biosynthesis tyrosine autokinase n=1 Tax=Propionibacterium sp. TaxID=1977903 RepID=UPI0039EBCB73